MNKAVISAMAVIASVAGSQTSAAEFEDNGLTIITDNFKVEERKQDEKSILIVKQDNEIGTLGDRVVVSGEKNPNHIAYVKNANNHNFIIKNKLIVQCRKHQNCIPSGLNSEQISKNIYEITVENYDQWKSLQEELSNTAGVINVAPSLYDGSNIELR